MRPTLKAIATFVVILNIARHSIAWNGAGHKLIASIAYQELSAEEQTRVVEILRRHPRFAEDFQSKMPKGIGDPQEWMFQQASIWPDAVKRLPPDVREEYDRPKWHYIGKPIFLDGKDNAEVNENTSGNLSLDAPATPSRSMNVVQAIRYSRRVLKSDSSSAADKGLYLAWLIHNVGEIHQPMNTAVLYSKTVLPFGDRGQTLILTDEHGGLRRFWDELLGTSSRFRDVHDKAIEFRNDQRYQEIAGMALLTTNEETWLEEGFQCARDICYLPEIREQILKSTNRGGEPSVKLSEDYYVKLAENHAKYCAVDAGYRLAAILKDILGE